MNVFTRSLTALALVGALVFLGHRQRAEAFTYTGASWATPTATYFVNANFADGTAGSSAEQLAALQRGASEWKSAGQIPFQFLYGGSTTSTTVAPSDGQNNVFYSNADGGGALATCTYSFFQNGNLVGFDIEFFSRDGGFDWSWSNNPVSGFQFDIEAVACHEFGHALGLDHSAVSGATMFPSITAGTTGARSLEADDIAGVQGLYGTSATGNPSVTSISPEFAWIGGGERVTLTGTDFSGSDPQLVTFDGIPATDITVIDDTTIECNLPAGMTSGPVDVSVSHAQGSVDFTDGFFNVTVRLLDPLSISSQCRVELYFPGDGGLAYRMAPCLFWQPGIALSQFDAADNRVIPVNEDGLFNNFALGLLDSIFMDFSGTLDPAGSAQATVFMPNVPSYIGGYLFFGAVTLDPGAVNGIKSISNAAQGDVAP